MPRHPTHLPHLLDPGHLDNPAHVGRVDLMLDEPLGQILPLVRGAAIDGEAGLSILVFALLQLMRHLLKTAQGQTDSQRERM